MSLFTLYHSGARADRTTVNDWLAGNLCRCTGYRPIAEAALASCSGVADDAYARQEDETAAQLAALADDADLFCGDGDAFFAAPATEDRLASLAARFPDATLVGGATDVGLWITKQLRELPPYRAHRTGRLPARGAGTGRLARDRILGNLRRGREGSCRHRPRRRRNAAPPRVEAGAGRRHGRGQHRPTAPRSATRRPC